MTGRYFAWNPVGSHDAAMRQRAVISADEVEFVAIRAQGPGGQNVNKVSSAVQLRFDVNGSSLPEGVKQRLLAQADRRLTDEGVIVIKAQTQRSQERNKAEALARLQSMVDEVAAEPLARKKTRPTFGSKKRRLKAKGVRSDVKSLRAKVVE